MGINNADDMVARATAWDPYTAIIIAVSAISKTTGHSSEDIATALRVATADLMCSSDVHDFDEFTKRAEQAGAELVERLERGKTE